MPYLCCMKLNVSTGCVVLLCVIIISLVKKKILKSLILHFGINSVTLKKMSDVLVTWVKLYSY